MPNTTISHKPTYQHDKIPNFKFALREDLQDTGDLFLPTRATPKATGWDVRAATENRQPLVIKAGEYVKIPLGFRVVVPEGWWYELKPRSSSFTKKNLHALYGTIDSDFENEALFACQYIPNLVVQSFGDDSYSSIMRVKNKLESIKIKFGEAIGQIIPVRRQEMNVEIISNNDCDELYAIRGDKRGLGGFGSTSK